MKSWLLRDIKIKEFPEPILGTVVQAARSTYVVYRDGKVWSVQLSKWLSPDVDSGGYRTVTLASRPIKLHRLLLVVFKGLPKSTSGVSIVSRHLDGDTSNNHIDNLEWGTHSDNWKDRKEHYGDSGRKVS